jgi:hypothetical protein
MHIPFALCLVLVAGLAPALAQKNAPPAHLLPHEKAAWQLAEDQLVGYNARDIEAFLAPYSEEVEVYAFPDVLRYKGKKTMRENYAKMFASTPDLHCTITARVVHGNYVMDQEEVIKSGQMIRALAIYHMENGKIAKVYFLPFETQ